MKRVALALAATLMGATAVSAQGFVVRERTIEPTDQGSFRREGRFENERRFDGDRDRRRGGDFSERGFDRRDRGFDRREREERVIVRRGREVFSTGGVGCRTIIVRRENALGDMVTKRIRRCD